MARRISSIYRGLNAVHERLFTLTGGRVGGHLRGMVVVKLTTIGRRSGEPRVTMLTSPLVDGDMVVLVASFRGGPTHPAWYLNLRDRPRVQAARRGRNLTMDAEILSGDERREMWNRVIETAPRYATYQERTSREIPLIVLTPSNPAT